jgi:quercetin dioxygenase-like cupin family protein
MNALSNSLKNITIKQKVIKNMKQVFLITILLSVTFLNKAIAQEVPVFKKDGVVIPNEDSHGATLSILNKPDSTFDFATAVATFAPGKKLDWHSHPGGQILIITDGTGYYQEKGKPKQVVHKGDVIICAPGVEHWHGASPDSWFTYIAISPTQKGNTIWLQKVTDEEYNSPVH